MAEATFEAIAVKIDGNRAAKVTIEVMESVDLPPDIDLRGPRNATYLESIAAAELILCGEGEPFVSWEKLLT